MSQILVKKGKLFLFIQPVDIILTDLVKFEESDYGYIRLFYADGRFGLGDDYYIGIVHFLTGYRENLFVIKEVFCSGRFNGLIQPVFIQRGILTFPTDIFAAKLNRHIFKFFHISKNFTVIQSQFLFQFHQIDVFFFIQCDR